MPPLPTRRNGTRLQVRGRPLGFSYWPMRRTSRRYGLHTRVFATDPWPVITRSVEATCPSSAKQAALAFLEQAHDYYRAAAVAGVSAAKPVLLYYCFMNLVKSFVLTKGNRSDLDVAYHGLKERTRPGGRELTGAYLEAVRSTPTNINVFDEFLIALAGSGLARNTEYDLPVLLPQIVPGHRLWATAADEQERFISVGLLEFMHNSQSKAIWLQISLSEGDLRRVGASHLNLLNGAGVNEELREVVEVTPDLLCFEQVNTVSYTGRAADKVQNLVTSMRPYLWQTVLLTSPYRKYYVYLAPTAERPLVLPQLASVYAVMYYLSSITRYRPHQFGKIVKGPYGPFIEAFLNDQPTQFLFLLGSEFAKREVTKAALV